MFGLIHVQPKKMMISFTFFFNRRKITEPIRTKFIEQISLNSIPQGIDIYANIVTAVVFVFKTSCQNNIIF